MLVQKPPDLGILSQREQCRLCLKNDYALCCAHAPHEPMYSPNSFGYGIEIMSALFRLWGRVNICQNLLIVCRNASSSASPSWEMMGKEISSEPGTEPELHLYVFLASLNEEGIWVIRLGCFVSTKSRPVWLLVCPQFSCQTIATCSCRDLYQPVCLRLRVVMCASRGWAAGSLPDLIPQLCKGSLVAEGITPFLPLFCLTVGSFLGIPYSFPYEGSLRLESFRPLSRYSTRRLCESWTMAEFLGWPKRLPVYPIDNFGLKHI